MIDHFRGKGTPIRTLCALFQISCAGFYKHLKREETVKDRQDRMLSEGIQTLHAIHDGNLGYRRMTMYINRALEATYSEGYIHRLMQKIGIHSRIRLKKVNRKASAPEQVQENRLNREFQASAPDQKWLTDVTEFAIPGDRRKLFLSPILDLFDNSVRAFTLSFRNDTHLVFKMFRTAHQAHPGATPMLHSDRGFQYTSKVFQKMLQDAGMTQSMSRPGKCIDNGPMENFFGILKSEMFYGRKFNNMEHLIQSITNYIDYYCNRRLQKKLGCMSPLEFRSIHPNIAVL